MCRERRHLDRARKAEGSPARRPARARHPAHRPAGLPVQWRRLCSRPVPAPLAGERNHGCQRAPDAWRSPRPRPSLVTRRPAYRVRLRSPSQRRPRLAHRHSPGRHRQPEGDPAVTGSRPAVVGRAGVVAGREMDRCGRDAGLEAWRDPAGVGMALQAARWPRRGPHRRCRPRGRRRNEQRPARWRRGIAALDRRRPLAHVRGSRGRQPGAVAGRARRWPVGTAHQRASSADSILKRGSIARRCADRRGAGQCDGAARRRGGRGSGRAPDR